MASKGEIKICRKLAPVFVGDARYRVAYGGRGSGKTRTFAQMAAVHGYRAGMRGVSGKILILREYHNAVDDSSFDEIRGAIRGIPWLEAYYDLGQKYVRSKDGRIEFKILGLRRSVNSIKSISDVILAWVDEAEPISEAGWRKLIPTIRASGSELWVTWNPESPDAPVSKRFREGAPPDCKSAEINWRDNPWFPAVLEAERQYDLHKYPEMYNHVWEGAYMEYTDGSYYSKEIKELQDKGRISQVDYDNTIPVTTAWDVGYVDATSIWFAQRVGHEIRVIDHVEDNLKETAHYAHVLQSKGYVYNKHILPSDAKQKDQTSGKSTIEVLRNLGLSNLVNAPNISVSDGRDAVRSMLPHCWFDADRCKRGIRALKSYQRRYNEDTKSWGKPVHDWASHAADAFRYLASSGLESSIWSDEDVTIGDYMP